MGRYEALVQELTSVGLAVAGFNLRGHGKDRMKSGIASFGEGGWEASIEDMHLFFLQLEQRFPNIPHDLLHEERCGAAEEARRILKQWLV